MENTPILDLGKSLRDILVVIGFPPEPTALLERVEARRGDPDIADLVAVIHDQVRARKAAEAMIEELFTQLTAPALSEAVAAEEETAAALPEPGTEPEFDESNIVELVERMKPRLADPGIKELVLVLELQTQSLRRAHEKIAELLVK
jgi:hypothetical protein